VRVAFVVSRKVGGAVVRNRVRRRLREGLRAMLRATPEGATGCGPDGRWPASFDALVVVRPSAAEIDYHGLAANLRRALDQASADGGGATRGPARASVPARRRDDPGAARGGSA
jgi:ribonuclease P protein component